VECQWQTVMQTARQHTLSQGQRIHLSHARQPTTIGNSVVALYYKDGVVIGFNASASQNGMNKHEDLQRYHLVDEHTAFGIQTPNLSRFRRV